MSVDTTVIEAIKKYREEIYDVVFDSKVLEISDIGNAKKLQLSDEDTLDEVKKKTEFNTRKKILDCRLSIDTLVTVQSKFCGISAPSVHTIQERVSTMDSEYLAIRILNDYGQPSEFFKFCAQNFLTITVDPNSKELRRWVWVPHTSLLISAIIDGTILYYPNLNGKGLSLFIRVPVKAIKNLIPGVICWDDRNGFAL